MKYSTIQKEKLLVLQLAILIKTIEEVYFLNTDTYSGDKKYSDRLLDKNKKIL